MEIYTPATKTVKDYGLGESIDVTINGQAVIPILADKIYKSPYSAIRELYVNEVTATKKALRINPELKPEIHISLNTKNRELVIKGVNSLGIDSDTFKHILAVMGNSGNNKENETGYYGLGFYSFVKISERIIINSFSLESGEKWACIAKSALKFETLPKGSFKELDQTGFEITLSVKNELDFGKIEDRVKEISKLSGVKTLFNVDGIFVHLVQYDNLDDYFKKSYHEFFDNQARYSLVYEHIENDDYELIVGYKSGNGGSVLRETFLINVPILLDFPRYDFPQIALLNVKNERKFRPSADRERFDEGDEIVLNEEIQKHTFDYKEKLPALTTLDQWYDHNLRYFIDFLGDGNSMLTYVKDHKNKDTWSKKYKRQYLKDALPAIKPKEFRISRTLRTKSFDNLEKIGVFARQCYNEYDYDKFIKMGFVDIDYGKKVRTSSNVNYASRLTNNFKFHSRYSKKDVLPENALCVIRVDDVRQTNLISYCQSENIYWIPNKANYKGDIDVNDLDQFLDDSVIYSTNKGYLTSSQILRLCAYYGHDGIFYNNNTPSRYDDVKDLDRFMALFYGYEPHTLTIRFYTSGNEERREQSRILETIIGLRYGTIYSNNIDLRKIQQDKEYEEFEEWKSTITDTRLRFILAHVNCEYHEERRIIFTSLQKDLNE
jgi:hypothetical protein